MSATLFPPEAYGDPSLRRSYAVLLATAAIITTILAGLLTFFERTQIIERSSRINYESAQLVAEVVGDEFNGLASYTDGYTRSPSILRGLKENDISAMERPLRNLVGSNRRISRAYVTDPNGTILNDYPQDVSMHGQNLATRDWYIHASKMDKPYVSEVYQRAALGKPYVVAIAAPIISETGQRIGYLVCQVEVAKFWAWLSAIHPAPEGTLLLIDQSGTVFGAEGNRIQTLDGAATALEELVEHTDEYARVILDPVRGVPSLSSAVRIPGMDWRVAFLMPMALVKAPLVDHIRTMAVSFGFCYISVAVLGYFWLRSAHKAQALRKHAAMQLKASHDELEQRVEQRTEELREAYTSLETEMAERMKAEDLLRVSEAQYKTMFDSNPDPMLVYDIETMKILLVNNMAIDVFGYSRQEFLTMTLEDACIPANRERLRRIVRDLRGIIRRPGEFEMMRKDGSGIIIDAVTHDIDFQGLACRLTLMRDVTEKKKAEDALRQSEIRYRSSMELAPIGIVIHRNGVLRFANTAFAQMMGVQAPEVLVGRSIWDAIPKDFVPVVQARAYRLMRTGEALPPLEEQLVRPDGTTIDVEISVAPTEYEGKESFIAVLRDITERKRAEDALRKSDERYRIVSKATNDAVWDWDVVNNAVWWGEGAQVLFGYPIDELPRTSEEWLNHIYPEDRHRISTGLEETFSSGKSLWSDEYRYLRADGVYITVFDRAYAIRDDDGNVVRAIGAMADVSERKRLQAQLSQAQKMESVGRLAGGVAHDFNNLLTIVIGNAEFALSRLPEEDPVRSEINEIINAAQRAAELTRQLLAFARKQIIEPKIVNVNALVLGMEKMMRRLLGEDVELTTKTQEDVSLVKVDPGQLEQVLLNLAINARDAMPDGGNLTIETSDAELVENLTRHGADVTPGNYVLIAVSDTGVGMDSTTLAQAFEPFFTTKEVGKGTGLGLAMCYGIVRQAGGHIWAYSEPGRGTTFKIFLPRAATATAQEAARSMLPEMNGSETILIVEDEPKVREMVTKTLASKGFQVLAAEDADAAIAAAAAHSGRIDLLLTDVVMPKVSGKELAVELAKMRPDIKVLFMSGYAEDAIARHGILDAGVEFLSKPFTPQTLATRVRSVLDENTVISEQIIDQSFTSAPK